MTKMQGTVVLKANRTEALALAMFSLRNEVSYARLNETPTKERFIPATNPKHEWYYGELLPARWFFYWDSWY